MKKSLTVYSVVFVGFDHYRSEQYLGTYESEDEARQVISEDDKHSSFPVVVSEERYGGDREGSAPTHYWIATKRIDLEFGGFYAQT